MRVNSLTLGNVQSSSKCAILKLMWRIDIPSTSRENALMKMPQDIFIQIYITIWRQQGTMRQLKFDPPKVLVNN